MPHCVLDYSKPLEKSLDIPCLIDQLWDVMVSIETFSAQDIKVRAMAYDSYKLDSSVHGFLHVTVSIVEGRTLALRQSLSDRLHITLKEACPKAAVSMTVDIKELVRDTYRK